LNRKTDIISISKIEQVPTLEDIRAISRDCKLKLIFKNKFVSQRENIGQKFKKELKGFQIGIHTTEPEINIAKLITDEEIEENQDFFEQCAKDYRQLAEELLYKLVNKLNLKLNEDFPMQTFNELKRDKRQIGQVGNWRYYVHGFHCGFENNKTGQTIEVPLVFGLEFGDLDPWFFTKYIKSTSKYRPLPVQIHEEYADGVRINERMISHGKFEKINSNVGNHYGIVVSDRQKIKIKSYKELNALDEGQKTKKSKFDFWKLIGFKK